jgi:hypothetical protein
MHHDYEGIHEKVLDSGVVVKVLSLKAMFNAFQLAIITFLGELLTADLDTIKVNYL